MSDSAAEAVEVTNVESSTVWSLLGEAVTAPLELEVCVDELAAVDAGLVLAVVGSSDVVMDWLLELGDGCVVTPRVEVDAPSDVTGATPPPVVSVAVVVLDATALVVIISDVWDPEHAGQSTATARVNSKRQPRGGNKSNGMSAVLQPGRYLGAEQTKLAIDAARRARLRRTLCSHCRFAVVGQGLYTVQRLQVNTWCHAQTTQSFTSTNQTSFEGFETHRHGDA